jgi:hemoglobin
MASHTKYAYLYPAMVFCFFAKYKGRQARLQTQIQSMKNDIKNRKDIELLVNTFYEKVNQNPLLGPIFNDVAKLDWSAHLPKMYDFWSGLLLGEHGFSGNPMRKHMELSKLTPMTETEFTAWMDLFGATVDELFEGEKAEEAKSRAGNIAKLMLYKIGRV